VKRSYWHPGHILYAFAFKPASSPRLRILAWGCNNTMVRVRPDANVDSHYHAVICLDPETMSGEAPPRLGTLGKGTEAWYGLLLPQDAGIAQFRVLPPFQGAPQGAPGQVIEVKTVEREHLLLDENGRMVDRVSGTLSSGRNVRIELIPPDSGHGVDTGE
jgi:hypothetical protein